VTEIRRKVVEIGAKPQRRFIPITLADAEIIERERRIYCRHYEACLDYAVEQDWVSWSCAACPVHDEISVEQMRDEAFEIYKAFKARV